MQNRLDIIKTETEIGTENNRDFVWSVKLKKIHVDIFSCVLHYFVACCHWYKMDVNVLTGKFVALSDWL